MATSKSKTTAKTGLFVRVADKVAMQYALEEIGVLQPMFGRAAAQFYRQLLRGEIDPRTVPHEQVTGLLDYLQHVGIKCGREGRQHGPEGDYGCLVIGENVTLEYWVQAREIELPALHTSKGPFFGRNLRIRAPALSPTDVYSRLTFVGPTPVCFLRDGHVGIVDEAKASMRLARPINVHDHALERLIAETGGQRVRLSEAWLTEFRRVAVMAGSTT